MQQKSRLFSILAVLGTLTLASLLASSALGANTKAFKVGIRLADGSYCATQLGTTRFTPLADTSVGEILYSSWASDTNGYDPDCAHLELQTSATALTSDFRICIRLADSAVLDANGNVDRLSQYGTLECTPWASENGGWSKAAMDSNGYDWDAAQLAIETRTMPAGITVSDFRIGGRLCDNKCTSQFGTPQFTPWASAGGGKSAWFGDGNWYDSDGGQVVLEVVREIPPTPEQCKETIPADQRAQLDPAGIGFRSELGNTGAPNGWLVAPGTSVINSLELKNGFNDRTLNMIQWVGTKNMLVAGGSVVRVPYGGNKQIVNCPANHVAVGIDLHRPSPYDGDSHETAILCKPVIAGTVDASQAKEYSINGCGQKYCAPYPNFPTWGYVMVGARFNTDNHKYIASIVIAPVVAATERTVPCSPNTCAPRQVSQPVPDNEQPTIIQTGTTQVSIDGTGTGWKTCAADSIWVNTHLHNGTDDRKEHWANCADTERMVDTNFSYTAANGTVLPAGQPRPVYPSGDDAKCASDEVMVGALYYDDDANGNSDEGIRAIQCRKLLSGVSLDLTNVQVFPNAGCGQTFCDAKSSTLGALATARDNQGRPFAPIGMNIRPNDNHKYARGIWAAPLKKLADRIITIPPGPECTPTPNPNPNPNPTPNPNPNPNPGAGGGNNGGSNPPVATCTLTANPATIVLNIGSSRLDWNCSATGPVTISAVDNTEFTPVENQPAQGSMQVAPDKTTTFKVTSSNASATATVTVGGSVFDETGGL